VTTRSNERRSPRELDDDRFAISIVRAIVRRGDELPASDRRRYYLATIDAGTASAALLELRMREELVSVEARDRGRRLLGDVISLLRQIAEELPVRSGPPGGPVADETTRAR
jgi:hypothetical protein